jgi:Asp-tRNA(Asn)/Glu-tRNA(Gln) amidotransferase A subunit family amidase
MSDAATLASRVQEGELAVTDVAESLIPVLAADRWQAWEVVDAQGLLGQARALDKLDVQLKRQLPLLGVPVGVKDAFDTLDLPTSYGSAIYSGHRPLRDAEAIVKLRAAGALIAGKTKCTEFSWMASTDTQNPIAPGRTPGGSSSGSAAAVAAHDVPLATGTQTAGSLIRPGSYVGVYAYKPTFGAFPRGGVFPLSASLDTVGLFASTISDIALAARVLGGTQMREPTIRFAQPFDREPSQMLVAPRLGLVRTPWWADIEPEAQGAIETAIGELRAAGVSVEEAQVDSELAALAAAQRTIQVVESATSLGDELRSSPDLLSDELREALVEGAAIPLERYEAARVTVGELAWAVGSLLARFDAVITPSAHGVPPIGLAFTGDPLFCRAWTAIGVPCLSLPLAWTEERLPAGLQLVGRCNRDGELLRVAAAVVAGLEA